MNNFEIFHQVLKQANLSYQLLSILTDREEIRIIVKESSQERLNYF